VLVSMRRIVYEVMPAQRWSPWAGSFWLHRRADVELEEMVKMSNGVHIYGAEVLYSLSRAVEPEHVDWEFDAHTRTTTQRTFAAALLCD
jgi:hypothetical protein